jgi:anti-sigma regulatory factor (Ser/Thr protein kinase)
MADQHARLFVSLTFTPDEYLVTSVSRLVSDFCRTVISSMDTAWRFYMAAQELAENITKYSTGSNVTLRVELEKQDDEHVMRVFAKNETSPERLARAAKRLQEITETTNPTALYDRLARESAPLDDVSGLGLARIRAEGGLDLDYSINGNELTISVHAPVQLRRNQ